MRKITLLFATLIVFLGSTVFAQPGTLPLYPYAQAFDSLAPFQSIEGQGGWINGNFFGIDPSTVSVYAARGINNSQAMTVSLNDFLVTDSILTPLIGDLTATSEISFYYRAVQPLPLSFPQTLSGDGGLKLSILPYSGSTPDPEQELYRITAINHVESSNFFKITLPLSAFAGKIAYFKFSYYQGAQGDDYLIDVDSLVINQPIATQLSNLNTTNFVVLMNENNQITITNANTKTSNSVINIYDVNGKLVYNSNAMVSNLIDASQWNKGIYFVQINDQKNQFNKKIIVR